MTLLLAYLHLKFICLYFADDLAARFALAVTLRLELLDELVDLRHVVSAEPERDRPLPARLRHLPQLQLQLNALLLQLLDLSIKYVNHSSSSFSHSSSFN